MKCIYASCIAATFMLSLHVNAEPVKVDMKPGLWQNNIKMVGDSAAQMQSLQGEEIKTMMEGMKKQMASMPPEQRKQMEQYMAQSGMKIDDEGLSFENGNVKVSPTESVVKNCVTQAEIDRGEMQVDSEGCTSTLKQISKNRFKSTQACSGDTASMSEAEVVFHSPKHYTGKGYMNQTMNGKTHKIEMELEGTWLTSDCGEANKQQ